MPTLPEQIVRLVVERPGLSDREVTALLLSSDAGHQPVNQACRALAARGRIMRRVRADGRIGNYASAQAEGNPASQWSDDRLSEDAIKRAVCLHLESQGWECTISSARSREIDILARRGPNKWLIEAKGHGSRPEARVSAFLSVLGAVCHHMADPSARYGIALPDLPHFRRLWDRLPGVAKARMGVSALFVDENGRVIESLDLMTCA
jgi:hypothetical protein